MSMYDKSYCATFCEQDDCERNLKFAKPSEKYYSVAMFSEPGIDHKFCPWKIKKEAEK